jgi:hypothetical protein
MRVLTSAAIIALCSGCEEVPSYMQNVRAEFSHGRVGLVIGTKKA